MPGPGPEDGGLGYPYPAGGNQPCQIWKTAARGRLTQLERRVADLMTRFRQLHAAMLAVQWTGTCAEQRDGICSQFKEMFDDSASQFLTFYQLASQQLTDVDCNNLQWQAGQEGANYSVSAVASRADEVEGIYAELARCWDALRATCGSGNTYPSGGGGGTSPPPPSSPPPPVP